jgi:hypothetical protein
MSASGTKSKRSELAIAALGSGDDEQVMAALERIGAHGDSKAIKPLLHAWVITGSQEVRARITNLLHQVKAADSLAALMEALNDEDLLEARDLILSSIWSAGLDARDHLELFVELGISGTDATLFECLTIVENQEVWPEKAARTCHKRVTKALEAILHPYRAALLGSMRDALADRLGTEAA